MQALAYFPTPRCHSNEFTTVTQEHSTLSKFVILFVFVFVLAVSDFSSLKIYVIYCCNKSTDLFGILFFFAQPFFFFLFSANFSIPLISLFFCFLSRSFFSFDSSSHARIYTYLHTHLIHTLHNNGVIRFRRL